MNSGTDYGPDHGPPAMRYLPDRPFPPYTYVPGMFPHPLSDPAGHSFGHKPDELTCPDPESWRSSQSYLFAIDLFNFGFYWEAHEVWEGLWHACGRQGTTATFLKGLIKLTAAGVKVREGNLVGTARHARRSAELLQMVADDCQQQSTLQQPTYMGLPLMDVIAFASELYAASLDAADRGTIVAGNDADVRPVWDFRLQPT